MFENPITFALLVSSVVSLAFYLFNREKDKKNHQSNPNMKYVLIFGIVFILGLIGRILFNGSSQSIESSVEDAVNEVVKEVSINDGGGEMDVGGQPPF